MNLAGFPAHISFYGIFFVITEQAPIITFWPIVTPCKIIEFASIKQLSDMIIGLLIMFSSPLYGNMCLLF